MFPSSYIALAPIISGCKPTFLLSRSEEHTSELQSRPHLVCRLLLEKKNNYFKTPLSPSPHIPSTTSPCPARPTLAYSPPWPTPVIITFRAPRVTAPSPIQRHHFISG